MTGLAIPNHCTQTAECIIDGRGARRRLNLKLRSIKIFQLHNNDFFGKGLYNFLSHSPRQRPRAATDSDKCVRIARVAIRVATACGQNAA